MFGDWGWLSARSGQQTTPRNRWLNTLAQPLVVIECGAGSHVPTVRYFSEQLVQSFGASLIRINPREPSVPAGEIGLQMNALEAINEITDLIS